MNLYKFHSRPGCRSAPDGVAIQMDRQGAATLIADIANALRYREEDTIFISLFGDLIRMREEPPAAAKGGRDG